MKALALLTLAFLLPGTVLLDQYGQRRAATVPSVV